MGGDPTVPLTGSLNVTGAMLAQSQVLVGAALLSGRALARRILRSEAPVDFQEPLLLRGVSIGTLHGSAARAKGRLLTKAAEPLDARMTATVEKQKKSWGLFSSKKKLSENYKTRK